ncbi:hypothetical protein ACOMHN_059578 [Nucella lapillus]
MAEEKKVESLSLDRAAKLGHTQSRVGFSKDSVTFGKFPPSASIVTGGHMISLSTEDLYRQPAGVFWQELGHRVCQLLVDQGAKVNEVDNDGRHPLIQAAQEGHLPVVRYLLDKGARLDHRSHDGKTALRVTCTESHREVAEFLLGQGSDLNYRDADGRSTLYVLSLENHVATATFLLDHGAHVEAADLESRTPLHVTSWQGHLTMVTLLLKHKSRSSSSNSSSDVRTPAATAGSSAVSPALAPPGVSGSGSAGQGQGSQTCSAAAVAGIGVSAHQHSSPSDSPESTLDRRKSYQSNNSSKSSSNMTTSTNQSTQSGQQQQQQQPVSSSSKEGECLTFTQQLQQCSMGKNRSRPISRVLSPVSEPQSPVQSPAVSPVTEVVRVPGMMLPANLPLNAMDSDSGGIGGVTVTSTGRVRVDLGGGKELLGNRPATTTTNTSSTTTTSAVAAAAASTSPALERNLNLLAPSPVKCAASKPDKISATINIITNPNADMLATPEEPVWQMQPAQVKASRAGDPNRGPPPPPPPPPPPSNNNVGSPTAPALPPRIPLVDSPNKIVLARRKRNGIVTNPKVTKSAVNNTHYNKLSAEDKKNGVAKGGAGNGAGKGFSNIQPHAPGSGGAGGRDGNGKAIRPTGLPLKKETPM